MSGIQTCARRLSRKVMKNHRQRAKNKNNGTQCHIHIIQGKSQGEISRTQNHKECLRKRSQFQVRPRRCLGESVTKGIQREEVCQIVRVIRQQVPRGWNEVPIVDNVDFRFNGLVARHVLWEEDRVEEICERWGASKIQIVIKMLGTGQGVMYAGQVVKIECLKVKFEWLKGHRSVQHPKDIRVNGYTPRECTSTCTTRGFW